MKIVSSEKYIQKIMLDICSRYEAIFNEPLSVDDYKLQISEEIETRLAEFFSEEFYPMSFEELMRMHTRLDALDHNDAVDKSG